MKIRIVLLPDKKLTKETKKASQLIFNKVKTHFKLDLSHIPHVTIIALNLDENDLLEIIKSIKKYSNHKKIKIKTSEAKISKKSFIGMYFQDDNLIKKLREQIIMSLSKYNKEEIVTKQPHITLTRLVHEKDASTSLKIAKDFPKKNYCLDSLAICKDGPNGTCTKIIFKITLIG